MKDERRQPGGRETPRGLSALEAEGIRRGQDLLARDRKLAEVVRRLVAVYKPERIYVFGSVACGESGPDSDYDLLVVVPDDAPLERKKSGPAYQALWGTGAAADVVVWEKTAFERRSRIVCSLPGTVLREGKVVYAA